MNRKALILGGLVLGAFVVSACGAAAFECTDAIGCVDIEPGAPVKVAVLQVISGELTSLGLDEVRGVELAVDDVGGEVKGHPIELIVEDEGCSAEGGTTAAQKVTSDPQLIGIVGTSCSGAGVPASQIMSEAGMVMISGSNTSPVLTSSPLGVTEGEAWQPGYFRTAHNDEVQGAGAANFMFNELGVTKIATIHDGDPYTEGLATVAGREFGNFGGELVHATAINKGDTDMRPVLTAIAADGPELIYFPIFQPEGDFIVFQAKEIAGLEDVILMGADGLLSDTYVASVGAEGVGTYYSGPETPTSAAYRDFLVKHSDKYGEPPIQSFHAHAYDGARILFEAIDKVAVLDDDGTLHVGRQALRDAMYETEAFPGITGMLACDRFGDCAGQLVQVFRLDDPAAGIGGLRDNAVFSCTAPCK
jgi:branched-chain amino acid transport system substrate-binding protein